MSTIKIKEEGGYNVNRCMESLHLNKKCDRDLKHLISYGRAFQYFRATIEKAD